MFDFTGVRIPVVTHFDGSYRVGPRAGICEQPATEVPLVGGVTQRGSRSARQCGIVSFRHVGIATGSKCLAADHHCKQKQIVTFPITCKWPP